MSPVYVTNIILTTPHGFILFNYSSSWEDERIKISIKKTINSASILETDYDVKFDKV